MTGIEKLEANEMREAIFKEDKYLCQVCGKPLRSGMPQLAHRIAKTKFWIKKYGMSVINHRLNLVAVCSLKCNAKCNMGNRPAERCELVEKIQDELLKE